MNQFWPHLLVYQYENETQLDPKDFQVDKMKVNEREKSNAGHINPWKK